MIGKYNPAVYNEQQQLLNVLFQAIAPKSIPFFKGTAVIDWNLHAEDFALEHYFQVTDAAVMGACNRSK